MRRARPTEIYLLLYDLYDRRAWRALAIAAISVAAVACGTSPGAVQEVSPEFVLESIELADGPLLLDARTPEEYVSGHVPGAINVPHHELAARIDELAPHRDRTVIVYCETGRRAALATEALQRAGFDDLAHLSGDMAGWRAAGLPIESR